MNTNSSYARSIVTRRDSLSLRDVADALFRKKVWIAMGLLVVASAAASYIALSPNRFRSEMLLLIKNDRPDPGAASGNAAGNIGRDVVEMQIATEMELLTSDEVLSAVLLKAGLAKNGVEDRAAADRALRDLKKQLRVTPGLKSNIISVSISSNSGETAASLLETLAAEYLNRHLEIHKVAGGFEFFQTETALAEEELHQAQTELARFEQKSSIVMLEQQKTEKVKTLADLEAAYHEAVATQNDAQERNKTLERQLAATAAVITTQSKAIPNQYSTERLNTMLAELRNKRTELLTKFQPADRLVLEVEQQIAQTLSALDETRSSVATEQATGINPIRQTLETDLLQSQNKLAGLSGRSFALRAQLLQTRAELNRMSATTGEHDNLVTEVKEAQRRYEALSGQLEKARLEERMDRQRLANVVVAEAPTRRGVPEARVNVNVISATALGIALVLGSAFISGIRRKQVFTPWELEGIAGAPVLGAVALNPRQLKMFPMAEAVPAALAAPGAGANEQENYS